MKRTFPILILAIGLLAACGEDRSDEYYAIIADRMYIQDVMTTDYLWYDKVEKVEPENMFSKSAEDFFNSLRYREALDGKGDKYSYYKESKETTSESRALSVTADNTYGIEFLLYQDPTGVTTHNFARILYVLPDSPAEQCGLHRGDWISHVNGTRLTQNNYSMLISGGACSLTIEDLEESDSTLTWKNAHDISMKASEKVEDNPILTHCVIACGGKKVGYLHYTRFADGTDTDEQTYNKQLAQLFTAMKAEQVDECVLDLRYNTGGQLSAAQVLTSLLAPESALGQTFVDVHYNNQHNPETVNLKLQEAMKSANLNLQRLFVLTSNYTASASEVVINGLIPYLGRDKIVIIGDTTEGKPVAMQKYSDERFDFELWPVVAYVTNAEGTADYVNGFTPDFVVKETNSAARWKALGDADELLLNKALQIVENKMPVDTGHHPVELSRTKSSLRPSFQWLDPK